MPPAPEPTSTATCPGCTPSHSTITRLRSASRSSHAVERVGHLRPVDIVVDVPMSGSGVVGHRDQCAALAVVSAGGRFRSGGGIERRARRRAAVTCDVLERRRSERAARAAPAHDHAAAGVAEGNDRVRSEVHSAAVSGAVGIEHDSSVEQQWSPGKVQFEILYEYHCSRPADRARSIPAARPARPDRRWAARRDQRRSARTGHVAAIDARPGGRPRRHPRRRRRGL